MVNRVLDFKENTSNILKQIHKNKKFPTEFL